MRAVKSSSRFSVLSSRCVVAVVALGMSAWQLRAEDARPLSAKDRAEIQQLAADYGKALGTCAAEDYARLFEPDGVFASGPRGTVSGRAALVALVESERHCNGNGERVARPAPTMEIEASPGGAVAKGVLSADGSYVDDTYVKTKNGWRFKLRQVITGREKAANLAGRDFLALRRLAGGANAGYGDAWVNTPAGWRFRSSGVVIAVTDAGVTGRAFLKGGGRYDDLYTNTPNGWRFQSRTFVAELPPGPDGQTLQVR
jgi:hypothetical protein